MPYTPQTWNDDDPATPISAARLTHMETGIETVDTHLADADDAHDASAISVVSNGVNVSGTVQASLAAIDAAKVQTGAAVDLTSAQNVGGTKTFNASPIVPAPTLPTHAATKVYVDNVASSGVADADASTKGKLQLTNHLGGTAAAPTVPGLATKLAIPTGTANSTTFARGDGVWAVPLGGTGSSYDEIDARDHGVSESESDNSGPLTQLITDDLPSALPPGDPAGYNTARGRRVYLPRGILPFATPISFYRRNTVKWYGEGGKGSMGALGSTVLRYTGTGSNSAWHSGSTNGIVYQDIHFQANNAGFTGILVDLHRDTTGALTDTALTTFRDCMFSGTNGAYMSKALVGGVGAHDTVFSGCHFAYALKGFEGLPDAPTDFCNTVTFTDSCVFVMTEVAISNVDESLRVYNCNFEGINDGLWDGSGTIYRPLRYAYRDTRTAGAPLEAHCWVGNWLGDTNDVSFTTTWLDAGNSHWQGCNFSGNAFLTGHYVIDWNGAAGSDGVAFMGNDCPGPSSNNGGGRPTAQYKRLTGATNIFARGNAWFPDIG